MKPVLIDRNMLINDLNQMAYPSTLDDVKFLVYNQQVLQEKQIGKWTFIPEKHRYECSECKALYENHSKYCPHCGSKMREI